MPRRPGGRVRPDGSAPWAGRRGGSAGSREGPGREWGARSSRRRAYLPGRAPAAHASLSIRGGQGSSGSSHSVAGGPVSRCRVRCGTVGRVDTEAVLDLIKTVAADVITPRFRSLAAGEVMEKNP